jgi:hypothetical protein
MKLEHIYLTIGNHVYQNRHIGTTDMLDKVFLCLITCYGFEVINGANLGQANFGVLLE